MPKTIYFAEGIEPKLILKPINKSELKNSIAYLYLSFIENNNTFLNESLKSIDTSLITDFSNIFKEVFKNIAETLRRKSLGKPIFQYEKIENDFFNGIGYWNTQKANNFSNMFANLVNFNQPINFKLDNASDISFMLYKCENFNQPINFNFNSEYKLNANYFLACAKKFNQNIILSHSGLHNCSIDIESIFFNNINFNKVFALKGFQAIDNAMNAFAKCSKLKKLVLQAPFTGNAQKLLNNCISLEELEIKIKTPLLRAFMENTTNFKKEITIKNSSDCPLDIREAFKNSNLSGITIICENNNIPKVSNNTFKGVADYFTIKYQTPKKTELLIQETLEKARMENFIENTNKKISELLEIIKIKDKKIKDLENEIKKIRDKNNAKK